MARRRPVNYLRVIANKVKKGRGQGRSKAYVPWLRVQDGPSSSNLVRCLGWTTDRVHHFLSKLEYQYYCILDWSPLILDIREQFPLLPLDYTLEIANRLHIKHPTHPKTKDPIVMTSDFLVDVMGDGRRVQKVRTVKPSHELDSKRVIEKFEIERTYWAEHGIDWGIVTEHEVHKHNMLARNVDILRNAWRRDRLPEISYDELLGVEEVLYGELTSRDITAVKAGFYADKKLGIKPGSSLAVLKHLIARKVWKVDMFKRLDFNIPMLVERMLKWRP